MNISSGKLKNIIVDQVDSMETTLAHIIPWDDHIISRFSCLFICLFWIGDWHLFPYFPLVIVLWNRWWVLMEKSISNRWKSIKKMNNAVVEYIGEWSYQDVQSNETSYQKYSDTVVMPRFTIIGWRKRWSVSAYRKNFAYVPTHNPAIRNLFYLENFNGDLYSHCVLSLWSGGKYINGDPIIWTICQNRNSAKKLDWFWILILNMVGNVSLSGRLLLNWKMWIFPMWRR